MSKSKKVRWAILGAGQIANQFASDFKNVRNADLIAVASSDIKRAKTFAARYNIHYALTYDELYNSELVEAVYVATTHNFHFEHTLACMQHGKAVLCEKPITINDAEFKKLAAFANEKQVFLMEAMWTYFLPAMKKVKDWIEEGRIGSIQLIQADFSFLAEYNPLARLFNPMMAGGALLDVGIYPIAFSLFFMNRKPDEVKVSAILGDSKVDEFVGMIFKFGDVSALLFSSLRFNSLNKGIIAGDKGYIEIPDFYKAASAQLYNSEHQLVESYGDQRTTLGYNYEIQEVTDCILNNSLESKIVTLARSNELQEIMTEIRRQINLKYPME
ncbi:MAG: Gfo/Idh/MocA family oxidoreductase [Bacteroidales bacterium]|jgi:predicted dehydrogenase